MQHRHFQVGNEIQEPQAKLVIRPPPASIPGGEIGGWFDLDHEDRSHLQVDEENDYELWLQDNFKDRVRRERRPATSMPQRPRTKGVVCFLGIHGIG
jgi:hypothetical protein